MPPPRATSSGPIVRSSTGRPRGAKNRLHRPFVEAPHEDFREHGADAIRVCRIEDPTAYLKVIASILPRELVVESAAADLSDEELEAMIANLKAQMLEAAREQPLALISHAS